jgi:5,10-methylenetetrahydromethanopterin reductase
MTWGMRWPGPEVGRRAEAAGCAAFCTGEFADGNAYVSLAEMAANTTEAKVGTGVAYAFARSPFVHASALPTSSPRDGCSVGSGPAPGG